MSIPYHTHAFELPIATELDMQEQVSDKKIVTPSNLGTAALANREDFAPAKLKIFGVRGINVHNNLKDGFVQIELDEEILVIPKDGIGKGLKAVISEFNFAAIELDPELYRSIKNAAPKDTAIALGWGLKGGGSLEKGRVDISFTDELVHALNNAEILYESTKTGLSAAPLAIGSCPYLKLGIRQDWFELTAAKNIMAEAELTISQPMMIYARAYAEVLDLSGRPASSAEPAWADIQAWQDNKPIFQESWNTTQIMLGDVPFRATRELCIRLEKAGTYRLRSAMIFTDAMKKRRPAIRNNRVDNYIDNACPQILVYKYCDL